MESKRTTFNRKGFVSLDVLLSLEEVETIRDIYDQLLQDKERTGHLRSDLAGGKKEDSKKVERITQIMRPSMVSSELLKTGAYKKALYWAKELLGEDMEMDFDMMINKAPNTNTPTPWHQDAAYWIAMPDKRSVSCWIALDHVFEENGCMWFIQKKEEQPLLAHKNLPHGGALYCETDMAEAVSVPLHPGGCTFHDGYTLHFSRGNTTASQRRALILNFRPKQMIDYEREQGVDHTGERKQRN